MKLFDLDSPLMQALGKMADLLWLNVLTIVCCLPIVTVGASLTALHYMALKIVRNEECYVTRSYFKSFKENFKQATLIWLLFLLLFGILAGDFYILRNTDIQLGRVLRIVIPAAGVLAVFTFLYVFPVLAKFDNTTFRTVKNAFLMSIMQLPKTLLMIVLYAAPVLLIIFAYQAAPLGILFGLSVPAWLSAKLYNKFFQKLEDQILAGEAPKEEEDGEDERIFHDQPMENTEETGNSGAEL